MGEVDGEGDPAFPAPAVTALPLARHQGLAPLSSRIPLWLVCGRGLDGTSLSWSSPALPPTPALGSFPFGQRPRDRCAVRVSRGERERGGGGEGAMARPISESHQREKEKRKESGQGSRLLMARPSAPPPSLTLPRLILVSCVASSPFYFLEGVRLTAPWLGLPVLPWVPHGCGR